MTLLPAGHKRWSANRKVGVVRAILNGTLSAAEARVRYMLSNEELTGWQADYDQHGIAGLQIKSMRHRRRAPTTNANPTDLIGHSRRSRLVRSPELSLKCIDTGIVIVRKTSADDDASIVAGHMTKVREVAPFAVQPLAHSIEKVGKTGLVNANLDGSHERAPQP